MSNSKLVFSTRTGQVSTAEHNRRLSNIWYASQRVVKCRHNEQPDNCEVCLYFDGVQ